MCKICVLEMHFYKNYKHILSIKQLFYTKNIVQWYFSGFPELNQFGSSMYAITYKASYGDHSNSNLFHYVLSF